MLLEFTLDNFNTDQEAKDIFREVESNYKEHLDSILIHKEYLRAAGYFFHNKYINLYIDYPLGTSSLDIRLKMIEEICEKCNTISVTAPAHHLINRKYDKIRKEISSIKENFPTLNIRYILDYRKYNHSILVKFASILKDNSINTVYPSSGFFIDNIYDNILAGKYLEEKSKINCILNGNLWTTEHIDLIIKSKPIGLSVQHIHSLHLLKNHFFNQLDNNAEE